VQVVVLGAGRIGASHAASLSRTEAVEAVVVADVDVDRAGAVAERIPRAVVATVDEAFGRRPDGMVITTPTFTHAALVRRAVRAGIAVFCEKPIAQTLTETVRLVSELSESPTPVQIGFQRRFDAGYAQLRAAVARGDLGALRRIHLLSCDARPPADDFIRTSGGLYRDCHIHDFDAVRWVTGRAVVAVHAMGAAHGPGAFAEVDDVDESVALLRLDGDVLATVQGSRWNGHGYDARMEVAGTERTMVAGLSDRTPLRPAEHPDAASAAPWTTFAERFAAAFDAELREFLDVARGLRPSPCTPGDALEALLIAEAADLSRRERRTVALAEIRDRAADEARIPIPSP
jgi:myo-inositol 2-dehydrogenase/D-chiro-inositol 1-dehydrogenase